MIKVFMTRYALQEFNKGNQVVVKSGFQNADDVEVYLKIRKIVIRYQQDGMILRKKKWYEYIIRKK